MRVLLVAAGVLVVLAGVQLFAFPLRTDRYFAWTVSPAMTAVFLGAAYWSSAPFEFVASRARSWAEARIAVPTVFVFTALTLVVTLVHRDRFHFGAEHPAATRVVTWTWLAVYAAVPVIMAVVWIRQLRVPGGDPPRTRPLAPWVQAVVGAQAAGFTAVGLWLLVAPGRATWWPWALTPLTGRAVGAWLLSLGVAAGHALVERDAVRVRPAAVADLVFAVLQTVALVRHGGDIDTGTAGWVVIVTVVASMAVVGAAVLFDARGSVRAPAGEASRA
jgi:hypothetical protein